MLARFERLMEQAVEGSLRRVFATPLQPIQLAKAAARAMEHAHVVGRTGPEAPNQYELRLAPEDFSRFCDYAETLCADIRAYLVDYAADRGLRLVAEPRVSVLQDTRVRPGSVGATARFADLPAGLGHDVDEAIANTRRLRLAELAAARGTTKTTNAAPLSLRLVDGMGLAFEVEPSMDVVRLGRARDNDVVLDSTRVSRYHAQLRWVESNWLLYDLLSTNGTWLDQQRLPRDQPRLVTAGSRITLGDYELRVLEAGNAERGRR
jgi:hypothetical protein